MNKERRGMLEDVIGTLDEADQLLNDVIMEEQDAFDNLSDGLQCSDRGIAMEDAMDAMEEASADIANVQAKIQKIIDQKIKSK